MKKFLLISTLLLSLAAMAQVTVTGTVTDGSIGEPAIGASVIVAGTTTGTVTDTDGHFTLDVPDGKFILQVSMVGYKTQVVNIKGKSSVSVTLQEDSQLFGLHKKDQRVLLDRITETGTAYAIQTTLITPYGLVKNEYEGNVQVQIVAEDLFCDC